MPVKSVKDHGKGAGRSRCRIEAQPRSMTIPPRLFVFLRTAIAARLLPCQPLVQSSDGLLTLPRLPELGSTLGPMGGTIWVARERIPPQRRPATGGEESVRSIDRPSMGLLRRPTLGEIVEDGRFNRSYGLGAHSRIRETGSSS